MYADLTSTLIGREVVSGRSSAQRKQKHNTYEDISSHNNRIVRTLSHGRQLVIETKNKKYGNSKIIKISKITLIQSDSVTSPRYNNISL